MQNLNKHSGVLKRLLATFLPVNNASTSMRDRERDKERDRERETESETKRDRESDREEAT